MMFWVLLAIAVLGFGYAAYKDLRTTEFPDWLPYAIILLAIGARGAFAFVLADWWILVSSLFMGALLLGSGLLLYYTKQWGDGDAWLFGALGFLYPSTAGLPEVSVSIIPFPLIIIFNFFMLSFLYLVVYSVALGLRNKKELHTFFISLRKDIKGIGLVTAGFAAACAAFGTYLFSVGRVPPFLIYMFFVFPGFLLALLVFIRYGRFVENNLFKRQINVSDMKSGDVPADAKWKVMTPKELAELKKRGGKIWIKEGVRFAPVFIITVLVTLFYGSLFSLFI
jgi:Flp pilus assembly protein protease CpaA